MASACCLPVDFWSDLCGSLSWLWVHIPPGGRAGSASPCLHPGLAQGWLGRSSETKQVAQSPGAGWGCYPQDNAMSRQPLLDPRGGCVSPNGISLPYITDSQGKGLHLHPTAVWAATANSLSSKKVQRVCRGRTQWCFGAYIVTGKEQNGAGMGC